MKTGNKKVTCSVKLTCSTGCTKQINHGKIIRAHIRFCKMAANSGGPKKNSSASRSGGRKPVKVSNDHCRICNSSFALMGTKCSNENLFFAFGKERMRWLCVGGHFVHCWCEAGPRSRKIR